MKKRQYRISLQMAVAAVICCSILVLAATLMYQDFLEMRKQITAATQMTAQQMSNSISQSILSTLTPTKTTLELASQAKITIAQRLAERLENLPLLKKVLDVNVVASAVYVGYDNGDFFMLRKFLGQMPLLTPPAPSDTRYLLQSVTDTEGKRVGEFSFYNEDMGLLERRVMPDYHYDPRTRDWYQGAMLTDNVAMTPPYVFFSTREVGVTMARKNDSGNAVVGIDITIQDLSSFLKEFRITPETQVAIVDGETARIVAYPDVARLTVHDAGKSRLSTLSELGVPILNHLGVAGFPENVITPVVNDDSTHWYGVVSPLTSVTNIAFTENQFKILIAIPADELLVGAWDNLIRQALISAGIVIVVLLCGWYLGRQIVEPLNKLAGQVQSLGKFNFSAPIGVSTNLKEVEQLGGVLAKMAEAISGFQNISLALNKEQNLERMLQNVLQQLLTIVRLQNGAIYLYDNTTQVLKISAYLGEELFDKIELPATDMTDEAITLFIDSLGAKDEIVNILRNRDHELIGILLIKCDKAEMFGNQETLIEFTKKIAGSAAVAIETRQLILTQKALLDGMIKLVADAIDTKSQYTGGHCKRVPILAMMIMDRLKDEKEEPFADFSMTRAQEEEFRIAAWLHDCGKITTPEYVVDKATKLETIYNRIHEIRMRFEVLHRDATIACLEEIANGADPDQARKACWDKQGRLQEEFAFVARSNIGGEFMQQADVERLKQIAQRTWLRHFDDHLGLSRDELLRVQNTEGLVTLPVVEYLLADKMIHIVPWGERKPPVQADDPRNVWGFDMQLPQYMYNFGEVYNLSIRKGTLTEEERFKINDHIVQTICMLSTLPLPRFLSHVPDIAGNHHEKMDGTGYPRKLDGQTMSIPERVMALADIFEALTASDRPYKDSKTLTQSLSILAKMAEERHVDRDVFNMFLRSGVYMDYARKYLQPAQIDKVVIEDFLISTETVKEKSVS